MNKEHMPTEDRLRELLVGKQITEAQIVNESPGKWESGPYGRLTLSDGTQLKVWGNTGGCSCGAGDYALTELNECDNIITNVQVEARPDNEYESCPECGKSYCPDHWGFYRIFVFAEDRRINLASFDGSDGNGYYGTGWWMTVEHEDV